MSSVAQASKKKCNEIQSKESPAEMEGEGIFMKGCKVKKRTKRQEWVNKQKLPVDHGRRRLLGS
jgi:hypothetical protein